ncbi:pseudouridine synthase [Comamonadaceae bacterium M7527]|nr:pseudouridine synthase [Comamonadaceae bacterium M7527]
MTDQSSDSNDARKPTLRAAGKRDNFGAAPRKPARGNAPLARFVKREPSAYELEVRQAASTAMQKLERAAARPEPESQPPRYGHERQDYRPSDNRGGQREPHYERQSSWERRDEAPRRAPSPGYEPNYQPRRDQRFEPRHDMGGDSRDRAAPRVQPTGDSSAARALSALANARPSNYRPSEDPTRQHRYERSNDRVDNRRDNGFGDRFSDRPRDGYERRTASEGGERGYRDQAPRFDDRRSAPRDERRFEARDDGRFDDRREAFRDAPPRRDRAPSRDGYGARDNMQAPARANRHEAAAAHKPAHLGPKTDAEKAGGVRLNKRLAELGMCSRREGDAWIEKGWVLVNGEVAAMGQTVFEVDNIEVADAAQAEQAQQVTILLHKPVGYVSGLPEDGHDSAATLIGPQSQWVQDPVRTRFQARFTRGLAPAGRLDIDSTGLIVFTQNGLVARQLIGENSDVEKEYLVRVHWVGDNPHADSEVVETDVESVFPPDRLSLLREGLSLDGQALRPAQVSWQNPEQLRFVLKEGKKRQIRRMCEQVGLKVVGLKRIRIGTVVLGNLPVGQWRFLAPTERFSN